MTLIPRDLSTATTARLAATATAGVDYEATVERMLRVVDDIGTMSARPSADVLADLELLVEKFKAAPGTSDTDGMDTRIVDAVDRLGHLCPDQHLDSVVTELDHRRDTLGMTAAGALESVCDDLAAGRWPDG